MREDPERERIERKGGSGCGHLFFFFFFLTSSEPLLEGVTVVNNKAPVGATRKASIVLVESNVSEAALDGGGGGGSGTHRLLSVSFSFFCFPVVLCAARAPIGHVCGPRQGGEGEGRCVSSRARARAESGGRAGKAGSCEGTTTQQRGREDQSE